MLGYAYNTQKMELTIIEEGSVIRRLSAGSRMCGEYIMITCVGRVKVPCTCEGRVKGSMYMCRD